MSAAGSGRLWPLVALLLGGVLLGAAGKPLQANSPGPIVAVPGEHVVLPCGPARPSPFTVVEWQRLGGSSPVTVHVERDGEELVREKAAEYSGRTAVTDGFSLRLLRVTQRDSGSYRCVLMNGAATEEASVSLFVAEAPQVTLTLQRTAANQMFVRWESGGWRLQPQVSLLDARRNVLPARFESESTLGQDGLYSVRAKVEAVAAEGVRTIICRVEIPGTSMVQENRVSVTDEFSPEKSDLWSHVVPVVILVVVVALVVFVVSVGLIDKLRSLLQHLAEIVLSKNIYGSISTVDRGSGSVNGDTGYEEYGDINDQVTTTGALQQHLIKNQQLTGVEASERLAENDLEKMMTYKDQIIRVGNRLQVRPAVIAAIISRQSQAGATLRPDGFGKWDSNCFGLMQINKNYHAVKGGPYSEEHVDEGVTFLIQLIKKMRLAKPGWSKLQQLKGALACYIAGDDKVLDLVKNNNEDVDLDSVTPGKDFTSDVIARAKWFTKHGF